MFDNLSRLDQKGLFDNLSRLDQKGLFDTSMIQSQFISFGSTSPRGEE